MLHFDREREREREQRRKNVKDLFAEISRYRKIIKERIDSEFIKECILITISHTIHPLSIFYRTNFCFHIYS